MKIIPAIDLMGGMVVRLVRGDPKTMRVYQHFGEPVQVAKRWEGEGAPALHVVDLDAALGRGDNRTIVEKILRGVDIPLQVGGGIRSLEAAEELLGIGVDWVVLGTLAFEKGDELRRMIQKFGNERLIVALDYDGDRVRAMGWKAETATTLDEALKRFTDIGVETLILTSISRDGTLSGPDYDTLAWVVSNSRARILASGGVSSLEDLERLKELGVDGVVVGRALYEARFSLREAIKGVGG
ncbi:MAG: 1-(5-phosphoribosyl)-5-[(5-phosphoribosylamino)methylideneamino]imidazole-4-carboxamide isomerase [Candidatus Bathyarchaeia archaeon]